MGQLIYFYSVRLAARLLPPLVFLRICESVIRLGGVAWRGKHEGVARNMRVTFPSATDDQIRGWTRDAITGSLNRAVQDLVIRKLIAGDHLKHVEITGLHHLDAARSQGRGVVVFSGHFRATRLARCYLDARGTPMLVTRVGRSSGRQASGIGRRLLEASYVRLLKEVIRELVFVEEPGSSLRILRRLREGGIVNAHLDLGILHSMLAPTMLTTPASRDVGILEVARLTRAPMVPVAWFGDWRSLTIEFLKPLDLVDTPDRQSFLAANMPCITATLEELIRRHPDQWELFEWAWRNGDTFRQ